MSWKYIPHLQNPSEEAASEMHLEAGEDFRVMKFSRYSSQRPRNPVGITPLKPTFWSSELKKEIIAVTGWLPEEFGIKADPRGSNLLTKFSALAQSLPLVQILPCVKI